MDEIMLIDLTFCHPRMGGGMAIGGWVAASTIEKRGRDQKSMTLEGLTLIQWGDRGRFVAPINELYGINE